MDILKTDEYHKWFTKLKDQVAKAKINIRLKRIILGNNGDIKSVGNGVFEIRINYGPGYRVYFNQKEDQIILLLIGGDKSTQERDIKKAKLILSEIGD
jgi:putative addiction module killer protein